MPFRWAKRPEKALRECKGGIPLRRELPDRLPSRPYIGHELGTPVKDAKIDREVKMKSLSDGSRVWLALALTCVSLSSPTNAGGIRKPVGVYVKVDVGDAIGSYPGKAP